MSIAFRYICTGYPECSPPVAIAVVAGENSDLIDHFSLDELAERRVSVAALQTVFHRSAIATGSETAEARQTLKEISRLQLGLEVRHSVPASAGRKRKKSGAARPAPSQPSSPVRRGQQLP